jgi:hypothetical protein
LGFCTKNKNENITIISFGWHVAQKTVSKFMHIEITVNPKKNNFW